MNDLANSNAHRVLASAMSLADELESSRKSSGRGGNSTSMSVCPSSRAARAPTTACLTQSRKVVGREVREEEVLVNRAGR